MNSLSTNLEYLRASPAKLLVLASIVYLRSKPRSYVNYMEDGFAIFQGWCKDHPGWSKKQELAERKPIPFNVSQLVSGYEINRIAQFLELPNNAIEAAMCAAIRMIACQQIT